MQGNKWIVLLERNLTVSAIRTVATATVPGTVARIRSTSAHLCSRAASNATCSVRQVRFRLAIRRFLEAGVVEEPNTRSFVKTGSGQANIGGGNAERKRPRVLSCRTGAKNGIFFGVFPPCVCPEPVLAK